MWRIFGTTNLNTTTDSNFVNEIIKITYTLCIKMIIIDKALVNIIVTGRSIVTFDKIVDQIFIWFSTDNENLVILLFFYQSMHALAHLCTKEQHKLYQGNLPQHKTLLHTWKTRINSRETHWLWLKTKCFQNNFPEVFQEITVLKNLKKS